MLTKKIYALFLFILCICLFTFYKIDAGNLLLSNKIIYLDPGHGGVDPGSTYKNIYEKNLNLSICEHLKDALEKEGAKVFMTRYGDYDLSNNNVTYRKKSDLNNRATVINKSKADMYISIHLNATRSSTWKGAQVFYDDVNEKNKEIAEVIQNKLGEDIATQREYSEIKGMLLNRKVRVPGVLIEVGFLSNSNDRYLLQQKSYQKKISKSITNGVIKYFKRT